MRGIPRSEVLVALVAAAGIAIVVTGQEAEPLSVTPVKDGLYYINGVGGNVGVRVTDAGVVLVDDKFPRNVDAIRARVAEVTDQPIRYVINTHHHGDHAGGNGGFIDTADVIAHENARKNMIRNEQEAPPRIVYTDQTAVHLGGVEVRAHHLGRGHTNGDSVVYFPDLRTVHGGDLLHGTAPFIDYANGGSSREWLGVLDGILALDFDTAIPGHGGLMTRGDVEAFRDQFVAVRTRMRELIDGGLTKEDAPAQIVTPELSWTTAENGLFMRRSIPGFYDEIAAEEQ
ncbi:MAG: MBL fold metallo-hydrolase [Acidobacteria bacterium]|nr:MBL fold metallo-hydrolase [Acidobacteriota bacterium]